MRTMFTAFLLSSPAAALAMGMPGGPAGAEPGMCSPLPAALYGLLAAVGYWVLHHADKDTGAFAKRAGMTVGSLLVLVGLLGMLCGVASHIKKAGSPGSCGADHASMMGDRPMPPPGPPPGAPPQTGKTAAPAAKSK